MYIHILYGIRRKINYFDGHRSNLSSVLSNYLDIECDKCKLAKFSDSYEFIVTEKDIYCVKKGEDDRLCIKDVLVQLERDIRGK